MGACCPSVSALFPQLTGEQYKKTLLGGCLIEAIDCANNLNTILGARPYQVRLVRTRWSCGERGVGQEEIVSVSPITPTPDVRGIDGMTQTVQPVGQVEEGPVTVSEISGRYNEDELQGLGCNGEPIPENESFYWEIVFPRPAPAKAVLRRYIVRGTPVYKPEALEWVVSLEKSNENRERNGDPSP